MNLARLVQLANLVWIFSELLLIAITRRHGRGAECRDRGSRILLWCVIGASAAAGNAAQALSAARIQIPEPWWLGVSLLLLVGGLVIRWTAILTLGRFFCTSVSIHQDHRLVNKGLFRLVRHPSYTGLLLLVLGLALSFGNWLSFAVVVVPFLAALLYRIRVEEASLVEVLGQDYVEYRKTTKCLVPGIF